MMPENDPGKFIMPFGKYKGEYLEDIPEDYLQWAYENLDLRPDLEQAMEAVLSYD